MFVRVLLFLGLVLVSTQAGQVTAPTAQLFQNTLKKWGVHPANEKDRRERYERLIQFQESVEKTTTNTMLDYLNKLSVMNNEEFSRYKVYQERMNASAVESVEDSDPAPTRRRKRSSQLPATYDYWENTVGFVPAKDQLSCGSCWSFPTVRGWRLTET
eukprot:sb/3473018/